MEFETSWYLSLNTPVTPEVNGPCPYYALSFWAKTRVFLSKRATICALIFVYRVTSSSKLPPKFVGQMVVSQHVLSDYAVSKKKTGRSSVDGNLPECHFPKRCGSMSVSGGFIISMICSLH